MVGWRCLLQTLQNQTIKRSARGFIAPSNSSYHTKAIPLLGEVPSFQTFWNSRFLCTTGPFSRYLQQQGFTSSRTLLAGSSDAAPVSSPLTPALALNSGTTENVKAVSKPAKVQAILKGIKQLRKFYVFPVISRAKLAHKEVGLGTKSPKKVNLVAALVRGMRVEDALLQLQVTVIHSARANATHNYGFDPDRLLVAEAFVGKGFFQKRVSYHAKGRSGIIHKPECRLTVVLREITPEEEVEIAKLKVSNFRKLTKRERRLVPHKLIESTPVWNRKGKSRDERYGAMDA